MSEIIEEDSVAMWHCPCGCAREFPMHSGVLNFDEGSSAVYRATLMQQRAGDPHVWLLLGSGSWFAGEERDCWLVIHAWRTADQISSRIEDPAESPFSSEDVFGDRLLTREEVFAQAGGSDWAFRCGDLLMRTHEAVRKFISGS